MSEALQLDVFAPRERIRRERDRAATKHAHEIALLVPLARRLAAAAGARGITVDEIRIAAEGCAPPLIAGSQGRALSWLSAVPLAAGLVATETRRLSRSRNDQVVWVDARCAP